ncbi:helix-turn-helix domain-containing protein [Pseudochelatococcus contaminans]|uniref:DNA-binding MarR family transcriptional regulator n=1 Tax=Pseudochelatococcus contaminans TaxID=1538103 RepID=A0A7W5Z7I7_9HYPH|nr:helix-turn-helix domain-containing protein [Pseudochelatococcus contaminans]MBB3811600.1 DNA-binding MarR family transcriptional regulator [Pseudochelatococcus contaminans]
MLRTQYAAAIGCARGNALDEIMREVWTRYGAGQLTDDEAGELTTLAHERRAALRGSGQGTFSLVLPPPAERCPTPVRRHSHIRGRSEGRIWRPTTRRDVQAILRAAEQYNEAGLREKKGERSGPLGSVALDVLRYFVNLIDFRTGRLEPSITTIMDRLGRSRDTIVRALKNLRAHGFIDWLRRYEPTGNEGRGPQVQQTSNAYRLSLPEKARQFLGRFAKAPPLPDDHSAAQEARAAEVDAYRKALPLDELALSEAGDTALGRALAALGKAIQKRESDNQTESPPNLYLKGQT